MLQKTMAIVLHTTKYGDDKIIVDLFTEFCGRVACVIKIPTTQKGKFRKQMFMPLTILDIEIDYRQQKPFQQLKTAQIVHPWTSITIDPGKIAVAMFLGEVLWRVTHAEQEDYAMFAFVSKSLQWLDITTGPIANFHIAFLVGLTKYLGSMPLEETYAPNSFFDMRQGVFSILPPAHPDILVPSEAEILLPILRMRYNNMHLYRMTREERQRCLHLIIHYYKIHMPSLPELKSLKILEEVFS